MTHNAKLLTVALELRMMARQHAGKQSSTLFEHTLPERLREAAEAIETLVQMSASEATAPPWH
ncbi:hypothetical protein ACP4J4_01970 [Aureimonas ureilytica]|uniref:hypothetical protein n=1 Tax=Aureimonas ureilytica TaxID=401562 RepID=UPI003CF65152